MITQQHLLTTRRIGFFCLRHAIATAVTVLVPCVLWTVIYFALLVWAMIAGEGTGSPASYPSGLLLLLLGGTAVSLTLFLPLTALAEWLANRRGLPILTQIPISIGILATLCGVVIVSFTLAYTSSSILAVSALVGIAFLAHLLPLGLYWWTAQGGLVVLSAFSHLRRKIQGSAKTGTHPAPAADSIP